MGPKMPVDGEKLDMKLESISLILKDMLKVIKVVSLYPENNPLPQSLRRSFAEKLESIIQDYGEIRVRVNRDRLIYADEVIYKDKSKEESLAGLLFETGITEFTFKEGLEVEEIYRLLDSIRTYLNTPGKNADLAALIWESGISRFAFQTLEDVALSEYNENFDINVHLTNQELNQNSEAVFGTDGEESFQAIFTDDDPSDMRLEQASASSDGQPIKSGGGGQQPHSLFYAAVPGQPTDQESDEEIADEELLRVADAASAMGFSDLPAQPAGNLPNTALILNDEFKLSSEEEEKIQRIIAEDAEFDPYESTSELLKELLMQESELESFYESVTICEKVLTEFIQAARLAEAGRVLQYMKQLEDRLRNGKPLWAERLRDACVTAGSRDRLNVLKQALNDHPDVSTAELSGYLENFGWEALIGITDMMGEIENKSHRETLVSFLSRMGKDRIDIVARSIYDKRPDVVRNAITILSHIGDPKALKHLAKTAEHPDETVRLELVKALRVSPAEEALEILKNAVSDASAEVRREAVDSIVARRGQSAFDLITDVINDSGFDTLEEADQQTLLNAYSTLGGDQSVTFLGRLIMARNLFGNHKLRFLRRAAFEALSLNRSERCEVLLVKLSSSWRRDIKHRAQETINRRREIMYGDEQ